ncbi:hypothetical protein HK101_001272 [Irineochytrium annulatum]|nr:hypothetical protein HK101_001272 [Irineochytrium annulatum]
MSPASLASSFTAKYVRTVVTDPVKWEWVERTLQAGSPFTETEFMVVASAGKISSEVITQTVGGFLDKLVVILDSFGGDVVKFLGDAVLVTFDVQREPAFERIAEEADGMADAARRAIACCATIMIRLPSADVDLSAYSSSFANIGEISRSEANASGSSVERTMFSLRLHIAITCGLVSRLITGGTDLKLDYAIHGACLSKLGDVLDTAKQGQIGISNKAWEVAGLAELQKVAIYPEFFIIAGDDMKPLSEVVTPRPPSEIDGPVDYSNAECMNFFRFITANIAYQIVKMTTSYRDRGSFMSSVSTSEQAPDGVQKIAFYEYRTITAVFVKFTWAFNAEKAHRCLRSFMESIKAHNGVFQQFAGDAVNIAARLLQFGYNTIACDESTHDRAKDFALHEFIGEKKIKGKPLPFPVWVVSDGGDSNGNEKQVDSIVVGYEEERKTMADYIQKWVVREQHLCAVIEGPSGVGKSTLLNYWVKQLERLGADVRPVLPTVAFDKYPLPANMDSVGQAAALQMMIVQIVKQHTESQRNRIVLVVDDAQWVDTASLSVILALSTESVRLGVLIFSRPLSDYTLESVKKILQHEDTLHLSIGGLSKAAANELIVSCLNTDEVTAIDAKLLDLLYEAFNGSPLLMSTVVAAQRLVLLENTETVNGTLYAKGVAFDYIKLDLASGILAQYDSLSSAFQQFLRLASTVGQYFSAIDIADIFQITFADCDFGTWIQEEDLFHFLVVVDDSEQDVYFRHITIQEYIYEAQAFSERQIIHLKIATFYESRLTEETSSRDLLLPTVAYHFRKTDDGAKILKYNDLLGNMYSAKSMVFECIETVEYLLKYASKLAAMASDVEYTEMQLMQWKSLLGNSYCLNGQVLLAKEQFVDILASFRIPWPQEIKAVRKEIMRHFCILLARHVRGRGGKKPVKISVSSEANSLIKTASFNLLVITSVGEHFTPLVDPYRLLSTVIVTNAAVVDLPATRAEYTFYFSAMAMRMYPTMPRLACKLLKRSRKLHRQLSKPEQDAIKLSTYCFATTEILRGNLEQGYRDYRDNFLGWKGPMFFRAAICCQQLQCSFLRSKGMAIDDDVENFTELVLDELSEFKKSSNNFLLLTLSICIARHHLYAQDMAQAAPYIQLSIDCGNQVEASFLKTLSQVPNLIHHTLSGKTSQAAELFRYVATTLIGLPCLNTDFTSWIPHLTCIGITILFPHQTGSSSPPVAMEDRANLYTGFEAFKDVNRNMYFTMHAGLSRCPYQLADAMCKHLAGQRAACRSFAKLKRMIHKDRRQLEYAFVLRGYLYAGVALCDANQAARRKYLILAHQDFSKSFKTLKSWVETYAVV